MFDDSEVMFDDKEAVCVPMNLWSQQPSGLAVTITETRHLSV